MSPRVLLGHCLKEAVTLDPDVRLRGRSSNTSPSDVDPPTPQDFCAAFSVTHVTWFLSETENNCGAEHSGRWTRAQLQLGHAEILWDVPNSFNPHAFPKLGPWGTGREQNRSSHAGRW